MASTKTAADRLAEVKRDLPRIEKLIDAVMATRRTAVLAGNVADRRRCDGQLRDLRDDLQACRDAIDWLPQAVRSEQQQQETWPSSLPDAQLALTHLEPWLMRLQGIPKLDRSAAVDQQIDHLVQRKYALQKLIRSLQPEEAA